MRWNVDSGSSTIWHAAVQPSSRSDARLRSAGARAGSRIAPDAASKTYFQLTAETKYEVSALLPEEQRLAVGSLNYHTDFFGRAFEIDIEGAGRAHSACIAFGLERLVCAFLAQHGTEPAAWPEGVRAAIRLQGIPRPEGVKDF